MGKLTAREILDTELADWRVLVKALHARFETRDFATALALVEQVGAAAEELNHHPDVDLRWGSVGIRLYSHDADALTDRDLALARRVSELAEAAGARPTPEKVEVVELALDSADHEAVKPFWRVVLGMSDNPASDDEIRDTVGQLPTLWFQQTDAHEAPRQRFHLDVHVPHDQAEARVAAAIEAGGSLVTDEYAPSFWVLADAQGNKACVCTFLDRE
jgi:4a-hydroxytetrahydrobiopterin dehydratase